MYSKFSLKPKIEVKKIDDKNEGKKKEKKTLSKVGSTGAIFKKFQTKIPSTIKKEEQPTPTKRNDLHKIDKQPANSSKTKGSIGSSATASSNKQMPQSKNKNQYVITSPKSCSTDNIAIHLRKNLQENKKKVQIIKNPSKSNKNIQSAKVKQEVRSSLAKVINLYHRDKKSVPQAPKVQNKKELSIKEQKIGRASFKFIQVIGEGGYGKVWKVENHKTRAVYAMKEMSKALIILKKSVDNVLNQLKILSKLQSPFISNITCAFNDRDNIYLGMDHMEGGDFRSFLANSDRLKQNQVKFSIACIIKSLEYIHKNKIFHRDVKPENIVIDEMGYLRLTDFGIARSTKSKQILDASGTPGYMAPQVLCKQHHTFSVDFYALGIICYELMLGKRPYTGTNRIEIRDAILAKQHCIKKRQVPSGWSAQVMDFVNKLIMRQPTSRLGHKNGVSQLINHPWFNKFQWKQLQSKKMVSPLKMGQVKKQKVYKIDSYDEAVNQYKLLERYDEKEDIFSNYYHNLK